MRKRRAIIYDDDPKVLDLLTKYFLGRGYEVIGCAAPVVCPVYEDNARCDKVNPCGDIMITDYRMPRMSGLELIVAQVGRGCRLSLRCKAVISGSFSSELFETIHRLGCATFSKPFRLKTLETWVRSREEHMDLSRPLGIKRRERRLACCTAVRIRVGFDEESCHAEAVNRSDSGLCLRINRPLAVSQILDLQPPMTASSHRFEVRSTREGKGGSFISGVACC